MYRFFSLCLRLTFKKQQNINYNLLEQCNFRVIVTNSFKSFRYSYFYTSLKKAFIISFSYTFSKEGNILVSIALHFIKSLLKIINILNLFVNPNLSFFTNQKFRMTKNFFLEINDKALEFLNIKMYSLSLGQSKK